MMTVITEPSCDWIFRYQSVVKASMASELIFFGRVRGNIFSSKRRKCGDPDPKWLALTFKMTCDFLAVRCLFLSPEFHLLFRLQKLAAQKYCWKLARGYLEEYLGSCCAVYLHTHTHRHTTSGPCPSEATRFLMGDLQKHEMQLFQNSHLDVLQPCVKFESHSESRKKKKNFLRKLRVYRIKLISNGCNKTTLSLQQFRFMSLMRP